MEKEIHEQPEVISHTLGHYLDFAKGVSKPLDLPFDFAEIDRLAISACGTAYLAGLVGKYWFERWRGCRSTSMSRRNSATARCRSRRRARRCSSRSRAKPPTRWRRCATAARPACRSAPIVNVRESTIARESDVMLPTLAGPEIGVASTKAFTCQLSVLAALAVRAASARGTITRRRGEGAGAQSLRSAALCHPGAQARRPDREGGARTLAATSTCSISAATPTIRWPWKAR